MFSSILCNVCSMRNRKGTVHPKKKKFCHLLILKSFQPCMNVFVLNTPEDILENVGNRALYIFLTMEVNGVPKQSDYKLSSKYQFSRTNTFIQGWNDLRLSY